MSTAAQVTIIGAGPGDPDLITLRGQQRLAQADVVFYAGSLVPPAMLQHCRPDSEQIDTRGETLERWVSQLLNHVQAGKTVVRLQDGDPSLYGTVHELVVYLMKDKISFEIVPGVSAFQAAAARLQTELTVPNLVQTIILTRTQGRTQVPSREDLASLARHRASLCLYLSAGQIHKAQSQLLQHYPPETPMALCYRLGWEDELVELGTVADMAQMTERLGLKRTVLYVVSPALGATTEGRSRLYDRQHHHLFRPPSSQTGEC
jgi:precorrin-4/cobalt-precorrin-4 C11-methyltransferase